MLLYRLLNGLDPKDYCLISMAEDKIEGDYSEQLPTNYYYLPSEFRLKRGHRFGLATLRQYINILLSLSSATLTRARRIAEITRREKCEAIVGCSAGPDPAYLPAAYLASRLARVPFYAYFIDDYSNQWDMKLMRFLTRRIEPLALKGAAGLITINEFLRDELRRRHGLEALVIYIPCDLSDYDSEGRDVQASDSGEIKVVYTGAVSEGQFDAFINLLAAMEQLGRSDLRLHIYTAQSPVYWSECGIRGPVVYHEHQSVFEIPNIQRSADMLFLPLAFNSPYQEHIRTAIPSKTGEYLASGRPILVHAPADSFLAWYFRTHECGLVVDEDDPSKLAEALDRLLNDEGLQRELGAKARARAKADFSIPAARAKFAELLKLKLDTRKM